MFFGQRLSLILEPKSETAESGGTNKVLKREKAGREVVLGNRVSKIIKNGFLRGKSRFNSYNHSFGKKHR